MYPSMQGVGDVCIPAYNWAVGCLPGGVSGQGVSGQGMSG